MTEKEETHRESWAYHQREVEHWSDRVMRLNDAMWELQKQLDDAEYYRDRAEEERDDDYPDGPDDDDDWYPDWQRQENSYAARRAEGYEDFHADGFL